jgi:hypothetical protein
MAKSRDLAKERYWRRLVRQFETSGLGARDFCAREGLSEHRLYWWRRTLRQRRASFMRRPRETGSAEIHHGGDGQQRESSFLPVAFPLSVGSLIEIVHPRGYVIRVPAIFDEAALGNILAVIDVPAATSGGQ